MKQTPSFTIPPKLQELLASRKLWAGILAITTIAAGPAAGLTSEQIMGIVGTLVAYIVGTAIESGKEVKPQ